MKSLREFYKIYEKKSARGGKDVATISELAQCYACAIASNVKGSRITEDDINDEMIQQAKRFVLSQNRKPVITSLSDEWKSIIVSIANKLFEEGYSIPNGIYHRNDKFMQEIYKKARDAAKNSEMGLLADDKWNPGDIWISSPTLNLKGAPTDSMESYNNWIREKFESKELIGISLKKLENVNKPKLRIFNADEFIRPMYYENFSYTERKIDHDDAFFGNKHVYLSGKSNESVKKMQGRTFESTKYTAYALEIMGSEAAGGKCGWTIIRDFIEGETGKSGLPGYKQISNIAEGDKDQLIRMIYELFIKYAKKTWSYDEFFARINKDPYKLFSQYYNLLIVDILENYKGDKANAIFEKVYNHAASRIQNSSVYIKIS